MEQSVLIWLGHHSVSLVVVLILLTSLTGLALSFLQHRRGFALPALAAFGLAVAVLLTGPNVEPPPAGAPWDDFSTEANFLTRWKQARTLFGEPIGWCGIEGGFLSCPSTYAWLEYDQAEPNPAWRMRLKNLGLALMERRGLAVHQNPVMPAVIMTYLAHEQSRGVDVTWWYGYQRTNPIREGETYLVYFDKAVLSYAASRDGAGDPAAVRRLPLGSILWQLEQAGVDIGQPNPWTQARRWLTGAAIASLLVTALPFLVPSLFGRRRDWGFDL